MTPSRDDTFLGRAKSELQFKLPTPKPEEKKEEPKK